MDLEFVSLLTKPVPDDGSVSGPAPQRVVCHAANGLSTALSMHDVNGQIISNTPQAPSLDTEPARNTKALQSTADIKSNEV